MLIEFGILNYKLIIPLIYPFFYQIRRIIHKDSKPFYELFTNFLGYLFGGLIYLIVKYRIRKTANKKGKEKEKNKEQEIKAEDDERNSIIKKQILVRPNNDIISNQIEIEKKKLENQKTKNKYLYLFIFALINLIPMPLEAFTVDNININFKMSSSLLYFIFFYIFFSRIILGYKIYFHQIFSLLIIIVCIPILLILFFINYIENEKEKEPFKLFLYSLVLILIVCLYSLNDVLQKKFYNTFIDSPYFLMFIIGLISLSILIPYELITVIIYGIENKSINGILFQIKNNFEKYSFLYLLIFVLDIISAFLWIAGIQLTIYYFTPCHFIISESLSQILTTLIQESINEYNLSLKIIIYALYIIIVFASLIYNEIIIINVDSLSRNTKKKIIDREILEKCLALNGINEEINEKEIESKEMKKTSL